MITKDEELGNELSKLLNERKSTTYSLDVKKRAMADEIKHNMGETIKEQLDDPDRNKPPKITWWTRFKIALGYGRN